MTMIAKFAGTCRSCGGRLEAGTSISWERGRGAAHATLVDCAKSKAERAAAATPTTALDLTPIANFIKAARERGLKSPKLRVLDPTGMKELKLGLTTKGYEPGSISVVLDGRGYLGCVRPNGATTGEFSQDVELQQHLRRVAEDPAAHAKKYAVLMCRCSFCGLPLTDAGSVEVGYGPVCAEKWGLPHSPKGTPVVRPVAEVA